MCLSISSCPVMYSISYCLRVLFGSVTECAVFSFSTAGSDLFLTLSDEVQILGCAAILLSGSSVLKAASKCAKVQFYFLFISCFLIGKWEQLCPGNKSRLFAYCVVIGLCIDGLAKSRCISVVIGYAN